MQLAAGKVPLHLHCGTHILFCGLWEPSDTGLRDAISVDDASDELVTDLRNGVNKLAFLRQPSPVDIGYCHSSLLSKPNAFWKSLSLAMLWKPTKRPNKQ